jgi:hypothetical protein
MVFFLRHVIQPGSRSKVYKFSPHLSAYLAALLVLQFMFFPAGLPASIRTQIIQRYRPTIQPSGDVILVLRHIHWRIDDIKP